MTQLGSGNELGYFLRSRRERVSPRDAGLPGANSRRRTPGLRREEVATLAGVSIDYYTKLERGRERHPSGGVLDALAGVLQLNDPEREHLAALAAHVAGAYAAHAAGGEDAPFLAPPRLRNTARLLLEAVRPRPAIAVSRINDLLGANPAGLALFHGLSEWPPEQRNLSRYIFLHPAARTLWVDWEDIAIGHVAHLHAVAGQHPDAPDVTALASELQAASPDFARIWDRYEVKPRTTGDKHYQHPLVGRMRLCYESLPLAGTDGQRVIVYLAEPGTPDHDAMLLLAVSAEDPCHAEEKESLLAPFSPRGTDLPAKFARRQVL